MRSLVAYVLALLAIGAGVWFGFFANSDVAGKETRRAAGATPVILAPVVEAPFADRLAALGTAVANESQVWARALLDIEVAYESDLREAQRIIEEVAEAVWTDDDFEGAILERPEVWGVQNLGADGVAIRLVVKTVPARQWAVERELRLRIKEAFENAGVDIPFPQRTVWLRESST